MAVLTGPIWQYIPLPAYAAPLNPVPERLRRQWKDFWRRWRGDSAREAQALPADYHQLPAALLERAAPRPAWQDAVGALENALCGWFLSDSTSTPMQVVVGPPHPSTHELVLEPARRQNWPVLSAPAPEQVVADDASTLAPLDQTPERPCVVPQLEKWYLRHHQGLSLVRRLLGRLLQTRRCCLVSCNSWARAYLSRALCWDDLWPTPLVLEPFDARKLERWFGAQLALPDRQSLVFRQADDRRLVLPLAEPSDGVQGSPRGQTGGKDDEPATAAPAPFLARLAAESRGHPGLAWEIWRHSLRYLKRADPTPTPAPSQGEVAEGDTLWVCPWAELNLPGFTLRPSQAALCLLQNLLLHGGLTSAWAGVLLPDGDEDAQPALHRLARAGLAGAVGEQWQVEALAYPAVRRALSAEGMLVDAL